jgi:hypothetical protein
MLTICCCWKRCSMTISTTCPHTLKKVK